MYERHKRLAEPDNPDESVWHYTTYPAYLELLRSRQLHFTRLDKLRDPYEGRFVEPDQFASLPDHERARLRGIMAPDRPCFAVHCWCMGATESMPFWERYGAPFGIAIRSTVARLRKAFAPDPTTIVHLALASYAADPRPQPGEKLGQF